MDQYYINIALFSVITIPYLVFYFKKYGLTPVTTFLAMEMSMFYGICTFSSAKSVGTSPEAIKLESIYVVAIVFFILGVEISKRFYMEKNGPLKLYDNSPQAFRDTELNHDQLLTVWIIIGVSVLFCLYLFIFGGVNVFIKAVRDFIRGDLSTYKEERAAYGSVAGAGYIYQFRVVLLPLTATYVTFAAVKRNSRLITIPLFLFMIACILGTGQRNAFVFYALIVLLYYLFLKKKYGIHVFRKSQVIVLGVVGVLLLALMTIGNGRVQQSGNQFFGALDSIWKRIFDSNQGSAITAFRYINNQKTVWGYDWLRMLEQILPGKSDYLPVDNISYHMDYGNYSGTNPPCLWGSAWYNFNFIGVTVYPLLIGICYHNLYKSFVRQQNKDRFYCLIYVGICVYLGIWTYGTPVSLFNHGIITLFILRWILYKVFRKQEKKLSTAKGR